MEKLPVIPQPQKTDFSDVDQTESPELLVKLLDHAQTISRPYKNHSFSLLNLKPGMSVLDVGCGTGHDLIALSPLVGPKGKLVGVDSSRIMLDHAKKRSAESAISLELHFAQAFALPFPDSLFNAVRADRVLHFMEGPESVMKEFVRVVSPGGRIVVSEPDHGTLILNTSESALTEKLLNFQRTQKKLPTRGSCLRGLFVDRNLDDVEIFAHTGVSTDFQSADGLLRLTDLVKTAVVEGAFTLTESLTWLSAAIKDSSRGKFVAAMSVFTVSGTRTLLNAPPGN